MFTTPTPYLCKHCNQERKSPNSLRNHERLCKQNPNHDTSYMAEARKNANRPVKCQHCNEMTTVNSIKKHEKTCLQKNKICPECNNPFRALRGINQTYCGNVCANTANRYKPRKDNKYTTICFQYHEKRCVVCSETKIVAVHHYDENHDNNDPTNLIPMCPTHHQYIHSRYKHEVIDIVNRYIEEYKNNLCVA